MKTLTVFITGERSLNPITAFSFLVPVVNKVIEEAAKDGFENIKFVTGDAPNGIERAVRYVINEEILTVVKRRKTADGKVNLDGAAEYAATLADKAVVISLEPEKSNIAVSTMKYFKDVYFPFSKNVVATDTDAKLSKAEEADFEAMMKNFEK